MTKLNSDDFKHIAVEFTEMYHPQWVSRVDRIWEMFLKTNLKTLLSTASKADKSLGDALGIAGDAAPEFKDFMTSVALLAMTYLNAGKPDKNDLPLTPPQMTPGVKKKFEDFLNELMVSSDRAEDEEEVGVSETPAFTELKNKNYRVWRNDTEPSGLPVDIVQKEKIVMEERDKQELLVIRQGALTQFFKNGKKTESKPSKTGYRVLSLALKNRGNCGTALNIAQHLKDINEAEKFRDLREIIRAIKHQLKLEVALRKFENEQNGADMFSNRVRGHVSKLNKQFLCNFNASINANEMDEYELKPLIDYCLIEEIKIN